MDNEAVLDFLASQRSEAPDELQPAFLDFEENFERKLWHQLTDNLIDFFDDPKSGSLRLPLFTKFIKAFADKINQLKLVTLALSAAAQCSSMWTWQPTPRFSSNSTCGR